MTLDGEGVARGFPRHRRLVWCVDVADELVEFDAFDFHGFGDGLKDDYGIALSEMV